LPAPPLYSTILLHPYYTPLSFIFHHVLAAATDPSGVGGFWDNAETLAPYRLLLPDGLMILFESVQEGTTDADVEALLLDWGLPLDEAVTCPADTPAARDEEAPELPLGVAFISFLFSEGAIVRARFVNNAFESAGGIYKQTHEQ